MKKIFQYLYIPIGVLIACVFGVCILVLLLYPEPGAPGYLIPVWSAGLIFSLPLLNPILRKIRSKDGRQRIRIAFTVRLFVVVARVCSVFVLAVTLFLYSPFIYSVLRTFNPVPINEKTIDAWVQMLENGDAPGFKKAISTLSWVQYQAYSARLQCSYYRYMRERAREAYLSGQLDSAIAFSIEGYFLFDVSPKQGLSRDVNFYKCMTKEEFWMAQVEHLFYLYEDRIYGDEFRDVTKTVLSGLDMQDVQSLKYLVLAREAMWDGKYGKGIYFYRRFVNYLDSAGLDVQIPKIYRTIGESPTQFSPEIVANLYASWLLHVPIGNFSVCTLLVADRLVGRFNGDYGDLCVNGPVSYLTAFFNDSSTTSVLGIINAISGIPVQADSSVELPFTNVNPDLIRWATLNLIPDPGRKIGALTFRRIYSVVFSELVRPMAVAHLYTREILDYEALKKDYLESARQADFHGPLYLREKFGHLRFTDDNFESYRLPYILGFWLRREIDGSASQIWSALKEFLLKYDSQWFNDLASGVDSQIYEEKPSDENEEEYEYGDEYEEDVE